MRKAQLISVPYRFAGQLFGRSEWFARQALPLVLGLLVLWGRGLPVAWVATVVAELCIFLGWRDGVARWRAEEGPKLHMAGFEEGADRGTKQGYALGVKAVLESIELKCACGHQFKPDLTTTKDIDCPACSAPVVRFTIIEKEVTA